MRRNNLAIYTLAGSILLSSVILSNQANSAYDPNTKKIQYLEMDVRNLKTSLDDFKYCVSGNFSRIQNSSGGTYLNNCR
jgi:hypothetical protein